MASIKLSELKARIRAKSITFDGDGHVFKFARQEDYDAAQRFTIQLMKAPASERPRGWSRGSFPDGTPFIRLQMH